MPPILLRVREEDRLRREKARKEVKEEGVDGLPKSGVQRPGSSGGEVLRGRALAHRLGGDVRSGLGALAPGLDTFSGWVRLQRLEVLRCVGVEDAAPQNESESSEQDPEKQLGMVVESVTTTVCHRPRQKVHTFYDHSTDLSVGEFVAALESELGNLATCGRAGCGIVAGEHLRWWVHGGRKVEGRVERVQPKVQESGDSEGEEGRDEEAGAAHSGGIERRVDVWVKCSECGAQTAPREMSKIAR
jgi:1-phosphatidylinositol-3-phosphate 5-kinase